MNSETQMPSPVPAVLLVDDEPGIRRTLARIAGRAGFEVIQAASGVEALEVARTRPPAIVVTDVVMADMDGYELVRRLRAEPALEQTPIVMMSGALTDERSQVLAERHGIRGFWDKTSPASVLLELVREALRTPERNSQPGVADGRLEAESARLFAATLHRKLEELRELLARLRALTRRMERIREEERVHIAREIHDEFGQALTALKMDLTHLEDNPPKTKREWARQCRSMHGLIDHMVEVVQNVASELRLGHLEELGLGAAVEWQLQEFQQRTGIRCDIRRLDDLGDQTDEQQATAAYRILQEALTNVARHAGATTVEVHLYREGAQLILEVRDNGRGITCEQLADKRSIGLLGMQERAQALGGTVSVRAAKSGGTNVVLNLPLPPTD